MNFRIRVANASDASEIRNLYNSDTNLFGEDETGYDLEDIIEYISDPKKKMFVGILEMEIIGALLAEYHDTYAILDTIIIKEKYQGKGFGKMMMFEFENDVKARNIPLIEALTEINNHRMQYFFEKHSFQKGNTFLFYSKRL
jgi:ribosomal protein S18 acetylase RimI-like enzyme